MSGGDLPPDGEATVAGARLPADRRLAGTGGPVLWATREMTGAIRRHAADLSGAPIWSFWWD